MEIYYNPKDLPNCQEIGKEARAFLDRGPTISFLDYDWALNAQEPLQP